MIGIAVATDVVSGCLEWEWTDGPPLCKAKIYEEESSLFHGRSAFLFYFILYFKKSNVHVENE